MTQALPHTTASLAADLRALGLAAGDTVVVHSSYKSLGFVAGGPQAVVQALIDVVGTGGTVVVPTHVGDNSDPAQWQHPPVPEAWWPAIRSEAPGYDPLRVAAALIVGAGVLLPPDGVTLPGGITVPGLRGPQPAFASWTPEPSPMPSSDLALAEQACRAVATDDAPQIVTDGRQTPQEEAAAEPPAARGEVVAEVTADGEQRLVVTTTPRQELVAAEQRGTWPVLVFDGEESRDFCLLEDGGGSQPRVAAFTSIGNPVVASDGSISRSLEMTAEDVATLTVSSEPTVPADGIVPSTSLFTTVTGEGGLTIVDGYAGRDVLAVVAHTGNGEDVAATVSDGRFVAWWPTSAAAASFTVTLRDGTVFDDVQPAP